MPTSIPPLTPGNFYHIYNRGNNHENIFLQERNYAYFLNLWWKHTSPIAETWAYCLLRNHFHVVVYVKDKEDLTEDLTKDLTGLKTDLSGLKDPSKYFSNFFNAYARGFNISMQRSGALFERPFKRIPVGSTAYLMKLIVYIHQNPQKHRFTEDFRDWKHSSYQVLTSDIPSSLQRESVMKLFGSREDFVTKYRIIFLLFYLNSIRQFGLKKVIDETSGRIHKEIQPWDGLEDVEDVE